MTEENKKFKILLIMAALELLVYVTAMEAFDIQPSIVRWTFQCLCMTLMIMTIIRAFYWKGCADQKKKSNSK
jgi:hypothetical protein